MSTELIINATRSQVNIAVLEDGRLMELHQEKTQNDFAVGDLYLGRVRKIMPGLNAAFVDIGHQKDAFLHYQDLGPQVKSLLKYIKQIQNGNRPSGKLDNFKTEQPIDKNGKIGQVLSAGTPVLVQIAKEAISTKGPRITSEVSLPGRYLVLVPFSDRVSISQKIKRKEDRDALKFILDGICPKGFGLIARTNSKGCKQADLQADLDMLMKKWETAAGKIKSEKIPARVLSETSKVSGIMRDLFNDSYTGIVVDDEGLFLELCEFVNSVSPKKDKIVKLHNEKIPVFEKYGVERQVKTSFGRSVPMAKGAYLVIEHTEALHVVDVNSGTRANVKDSQESNNLEVNLIAAKEIARQLRLRDMGGIIVVDFIDLNNSENRKILFEKLREFMKDDRAKHKILPPSKFGLIQITRQRVRPETEIETQEPDPNGQGHVINAPIQIIRELEDAIEQVIAADHFRGVSLHIHPFIAAYLKAGFVSIRTKWLFKYGKWIKITPRDAFQYLQYRFYDKDGKLIKV